MSKEAKMWLEVKENSNKSSYRLYLNMSEMQVLIGSFYTDSSNMFVSDFPQVGKSYNLEDMAYYIAEYRMGAEVVNMIPMHLPWDKDQYSVGSDA